MGKKVIVCGSLITDMSVIVDRHPSVGETVIGSDITYSPGGKGLNQAVSSKRLGAETILIGKIGADKEGEDFLDFLHIEGISAEYILEDYKCNTGSAIIVVSEKTGNNSIVVSPGANMLLTPKNLKKEGEYNSIPLNEIKEGDVLIAQFETPLETTKCFFTKGREMNSINVFNPAPAKAVDKDLMDLIDVLIMNETELSLIVGYSVAATKEDVETALINLFTEYGNKFYIATLGDKGVIALYNEEFYHIQPNKVKAVDTTGAGDCFVGAIAAFLSKDDTQLDLEGALRFANDAASISVTRKGSGISMPRLEELVNYKV